MAALDYDALTARDSEAFAAVLDTGDLDARVPGCPEWTLRDLAYHLGRVQRFWAKTVRIGADVDPTRPTDETLPTRNAELAAWMRASTRDLQDALRTAPADQPAWVWWRDNRTAGAIARHQVQEAAVHRWDAQSAVGTPAPLDAAVADDGVEEFLWIARQMRDPAPIELVATDTGRSFTASDQANAVTVTASASDLVLLLYGRITPDAVDVVGDRTALDAFLQSID
jgi:uncharacterized protein (TIGR03083 family)